MLLVIDSGNTNVVFALYEGTERVGLWRCSNDPKRTADEYAVWLMQLMTLKGVRLGEIQGSVLASVVPDTAFHLETLCREYCGGSPLVVGREGVHLGLKVLVDHPEQVGADRLVNAVAGFVQYGGPLILLDFGTATTFDVIDGNGDYCGGVIAPGVSLSVEALYQAAAQLPRIDVKPTTILIGKATIPAMQSGVFWGYVAMIEGLVRRIREAFAADARVIATGGLSALFAGYAAEIDQIAPFLTLDGLVEIHRRNQPPRQ